VHRGARTDRRPWRARRAFAQATTEGRQHRAQQQQRNDPTDDRTDQHRPPPRRAAPGDGRDHGRPDYRRGDRDRYRNDDRRYGYRDHDYRDRDYRNDRRYYRPAPRVVYRPVYRPVHVAPRWVRGGRYYDRGYGPTYAVNDYYGYGLRAPPRGYYWRRSDAGDFLLVALATGIIADLVLSH